MCKLCEAGKHRDRYREVLKENAIRLAQEHRKNCPGESCDISLMMFLLLLDRAGIQVSDEEMKNFV